MRMTLAEAFLSVMDKTLDVLQQGQKSDLNRARKGKFIPH
jgi:hypothetical protein